MAIKASTGLRNALMVTGSLKDTLDGGKIRIFGGTAPATADEAESGTLLVELTLNSEGTGLSFESTATNGTLVKDPAEVWSGTNVGTGTATYYRFVAAGDTGAASGTDARVQGTVGISGADMNLSNINLVSGAPQLLDFYSLTLPTL